MHHLVTLFLCLAALLIVTNAGTLPRHEVKFHFDPNAPLPLIRSLGRSSTADVVTLIKSNGYPCEEHKVQTEDGYILTIHRIPHGKSGPTTGNRPVIFLQHGLADSAAAWVIEQPSDSFGYILADAGFDVWLGNSRGNTYSSQHISLPVDSDKFWAFSWDEMARYDLPANIDYITTKTGAANLTYVGHSQGTQIAFAKFSGNSELAKKINLFIAFAPVAYLGNLSVRLLYLIAQLPEWIDYQVLGRQAVLQSGADLAAITPFVCKHLPEACQLGICLLAGCENLENVNSTILPTLFSNFPAGTSVQNLVHYGQSVKSKKFQAYDFGTSGNEQHYNQSIPLQYDLKGFIPPSFIFYGGKDTLADPEDVEKMLLELPTPLYKEFIAEFGHADFIWGGDAHAKLYTPLIRKVQSFLGI